MAEDAGIGVGGFQRLQQTDQGTLLTGCAGVTRIPLGVEASLIAHTDGVLVVVPGMCPDQVLVASLVAMPGAGDVVVVASEAEACLVVGDERRHRKRSILPGGTTMNDNEINLSHFCEVKGEK